MAAYRRVDDLLRADCLYTGISSGPNARCRVWKDFTFYLFTIIKTTSLCDGDAKSVGGGRGWLAGDTDGLAASDSGRV